MYDNLLEATAALHEISTLREQLHTRAGQAPIAAADQSLEAQLDAIAGPEHTEPGSRRDGPAHTPTLTTARLQVARLEHTLQQADQAPTTAQTAAAQTTLQPIATLLAQWFHLKSTEVKALNQQLLSQHLAALTLNTFRLDHGVEDQLQSGDDN